MGIGVSYTGNGTRREFELEGVPGVGTPEAGILGAQRSDASNPLALLRSSAPGGVPLEPVPSLGDDADRGKVKLTDGDTPDVLSRKLSPAGSIASDGLGLCLKGEEGGTPGGRRVYASVDGARGFFPLDQIDPYSGGTRLVGTGDTPDGGSAQLGGKEGASIRMGGRSHLAVEIDEDGNTWLVVKDFYRMADLSPYGRIVRISSEIEVPVLKLKVGGAGGGGKYGVRLFSTPVEGDPSHPVPLALAFGSEADLDTYDNDAGAFGANGVSGEGGEPRVKVVLIDEENTGG